MFSLIEKAAIVTGGAAGLGLAIAQRFIAAGCKVLIADRRPERARTASKIDAEFFQADVSEESQVMEMFEVALQKFKQVAISWTTPAINPLGRAFSNLTP